MTTEQKNNMKKEQNEEKTSDKGPNDKKKWPQKLNNKRIKRPKN